MKYKIIVDSCGELTPEMKQDERFASAALTLEVGADTIVDDDSFDQADFLIRNTVRYFSVAARSRSFGVKSG